MNEQVTDQQIDRIFSTVDISKLGEWETKFIASTKEYWKKNRKLSDKQKKRLGEIWTKQSAKPR